MRKYTGANQILREVGHRIDAIHRKARDHEPLAPQAVEVGDLRHGRGLAQELQEVDPRLFHVLDRRRHVGQRRPAELAFDVAQELLDAHGGGERLLALQAHQGIARFLVREVQADRPARDQAAAHQQDDEGEVLLEQACAASRHLPSQRQYCCAPRARLRVRLVGGL